MLENSQTSRRYSFKEISSITNVKPYVLRFWETEFDEINPTANELGEKYYSEKDVQAIERVKKLLFEDKLSIPDAKLKFFDLEVRSNEAFTNLDLTKEVVGFSSGPTGKQALHMVHEKISEIKKRNGWD